MSKVGGKTAVRQ